MKSWNAKNGLTNLVNSLLFGTLRTGNGNSARRTATNCQKVKNKPKNCLNQNIAKI